MSSGKWTSLWSRIALAMALWAAIIAVPMRPFAPGYTFPNSLRGPSATCPIAGPGHLLGRREMRGSGPSSGSPGADPASIGLPIDPPSSLFPPLPLALPDGKGSRPAPPRAPSLFVVESPTDPHMT